MSAKKSCIECGSSEVYEVEFRTDYAKARLLNPMNDGLPEIGNDDLPYRLSGCYCNSCKSLVSSVS